MLVPLASTTDERNAIVKILFAFLLLQPIALVWYTYSNDKALYTTAPPVTVAFLPAHNEFVSYTTSGTYWRMYHVNAHDCKNLQYSILTWRISYKEISIRGIAQSVCYLKHRDVPRFPCALSKELYWRPQAPEKHLGNTLPLSILIIIRNNKNYKG